MHSEREIIIEFKNVSFGYGELSIIENSTFHVHRNDSLTILGPNGGGKTTLVKLMLGLLKPTSGAIRILGTTPDKASKKIGYVPQSLTFDPKFPINVSEVVLMGRLGHSKFPFYSRKAKDKVREALKSVHIEELYSKSFSDLSGGERQRVLIARALATEPEILILDEPTANVDPAVENKFYKLLKELSEHLTIVTVSHDLAFVSEFTKRVLCVNKNVRIHPTSEVTGEMITSLYNGKVKMVLHDQCCSESGHING